MSQALIRLGALVFLLGIVKLQADDYFGTTISFWIVVGISFYFLPSIIALLRDHKNRAAIFVLDLFLGWSFIGWVVALVWSFTVAQENVVVTSNHNKTKSE